MFSSVTLLAFGLLFFSPSSALIFGRVCKRTKPPASLKSETLSASGTTNTKRFQIPASERSKVLQYQAARLSPVSRIKSAWRSYLSSSSNALWQAVFSECDCDNDGFVDRREMLALFARLGVPIPAENEMKNLFLKYDIDENNALDFKEFTSLVNELEETAFRPMSIRQWFRERRNVALWRSVFDSLDTMPRNGYLEANELGQAFERAGVPATEKLLERQLSKYDSNMDGRLSFQEFSRMSTDLFSSFVLYESALGVAQARLIPYDEASAIAAAANEHHEKVDAERRRAAKKIATSGTEEALQAAILTTLEKRIGESSFTEAIGVLTVQDDLFRRFRNRYDAMLCDVEQMGCAFDSQAVELNDYLTPERVQLLEAIKVGDVPGIRALTNMDWDFVYPPAVVNETTGERTLEAWCRSPLCLLVRPDEGNFQAWMIGVTDKERQELIEDVLASGCANPNFPPIYWGGPAVHACFEGDVESLDALRVAGCDLRQRIEWLTQEKPLFTLVHAAAFNGQVEVLRYLRKYIPPSFFREVDDSGSNALHTLLESSRDMETARFLLDVGVDGFKINSLGRSPLSMSIEVLPELASILLASKSRFEYRWWGNELYWFSFSGVVLPLVDSNGEHVEDQVMQLPAGHADGTTRKLFPLSFKDMNGLPTTIEDLIVRHDRKELLLTPVMLDLIERKWLYFAGKAYRERILLFTSMLISVFVISTGETGTPVFYGAALSTAGTYALFVREKYMRLRVKIESGERGRGDKPSDSEAAVRKGMEVEDISIERRTADVLANVKSFRDSIDWKMLSEFSFFDGLDLYILLLVPVVTIFRILMSSGMDINAVFGLPEQTYGVLAGLDGALQVTIALSLLNLVALFRVLGPLLITVVQMVADGLRFAVIIVVVLLGYANGFYALLHFDTDANYLSSLNFDYSYVSIITEMSLWLTGQPNLDLLTPLPPGMQFGGSILFWSFIVTSYFVLLNLLIAIFNTTYERIQTNSLAEWLFIRLRATIEFESDKTLDGVITYYDQLQGRDNRRAVRELTNDVDLDTD